MIVTPYSKFILGTVQFGLNYGINNINGKPSEDNVFETFNYAFNNGIKTLDTADAYGNAYELIGKFHRLSNNQFNINTKFICDGSIDIQNQLDNSLKLLAVNSINVYFYHRYADILNYKDSLTTILKLKSAKLVNKIGVSVYSNIELKSAIENDEIDCIQLPFNLLDNNYQRAELLRKAKSRNKEIQVRSVFLQGLFFTDINSYPHYLLPLKKYVLELKDIAEKSKKSIEELALGYVLSENIIDNVLIGVDNKTQLQNNIINAALSLDKETKVKIDSIAVHETELLYPYNWK